MIHGFEVICEKLLKKPLPDCSFAIQGLGAVGMNLLKKLKQKGCEKIFVADVNKPLCKKAENLGAEVVKREGIFLKKVDILAPCAFGGVINDKIIPNLKCKIIAGGANNQLADKINTDKKLLKRGIIFIPDFVINSGGFLQAIVERRRGTVKDALEKSKIVGEKLKLIINHPLN